ncbi:hypothetical protein [Gimesia maris]|jgi:ribosomal protein L37AE/L43A|uniref:hypothetical protein n=1 Tax=Gimesia maris TaxID=122 RepID=UPI00241F24FD|nr:hypothetical protein [Gimesia maris]|tara:strand:+ start:728 stop:1003 length:276 start_codon:yes stop_codon:yes gene_type:complete
MTNEEEINHPPFRIKRKRRDKTTCPFCTKRIEKTASGGRRLKFCKQCGATVIRDCLKSRCAKSELPDHRNTFNIWDEAPDRENKMQHPISE